MVLGLSKALAAADVNVTILTTNSNGDAGQPPLAVPCDRPIVQEGYQIRYFNCSPFRRYKFSLNLLNWLYRNAHVYDLAHIHALFSPVTSMAAAIARQQKLPYILRPLGTLDPADLEKKQKLKKAYASVLEAPNLAGAAGVHFTTDQEAKISQRFGAQTRDFVIPLGVTPSSQLVRSPDRSNPVPKLLFMSRLDQKKGLDLLLPALEQLLREGLQFQFVLAGSNAQDPAYEAEVRSRIETSILKDHTELTGFVSGDRKVSLLQSADLFILPSYYENFGIAVAEAMVAGVPVVISKGVYIWDEVSRSESGWVCECAVDSLVEQLRAALSDRAERVRRGERAKAYALETYSWEAIAQQVMGMYGQILGR
jgi:glycosyltransferase involved in cell wall biosynthesis